MYKRQLVIKEDDLDPSLIRAKYSTETAERLLSTKKELKELEKGNNPSFAIEINHNFYITKKVNHADATVRIAKDGEIPVQIIKEQKDPSNTHKYSQGHCVKEINKILSREKVGFEYYDPINKKTRRKFTTGDFQLFLKFYELKTNERYTYRHVIGNMVSYSYSFPTIEFIVNEVRKDPKHVVKNVKREMKKRT